MRHIIAIQLIVDCPEEQVATLGTHCCQTIVKRLSGYDEIEALDCNFTATRHEPHPADADKWIERPIKNITPNESRNQD